MRGPVVQRRWVEVGSIGPNDRMHLGIDTNLRKNRGVSERAKKTTEENRREIDATLKPVIEAQAQGVRRDDFDELDAVNGMAHRSLGERFDWARWLSLLQAIPVIEQFLLVQLGPCLDEPTLARQRATWCCPPTSVNIRTMIP